MAHRNLRDLDMIVSKTRMSWLGLGAFWALASGLPAVADDTELFIGNSLSSTAQPNILFIVDNSGSMGSLVLTQNSFDSATPYPAAGCDPTRVYWRTGVGNPPACSTDRWFNASALRCNVAAQAFLTAGYYTDRMAQYDPNNVSGGRRWENINYSQKSRVVECQDDRGIHGDGVNTSNLYARNGATSAGYWGGAGNEISWGSWPANETYTLYSGNYLNWAYGPTGLRTRLEVVQDVATDLLDSINGVNVGLAYFNRNTDSTNDGGRIGYALEDIATARGPLQSTILGLTPDGNTPLAETLYESALYYSGDRVLYGDPNRSVPESRDPNDSSLYDTPMDYNCQKNFIVLLTDGAPTRDDTADSLIPSMTDGNGGSFSNLVGGTCDDDGFSTSGGRCLDDLAEFLYDGDFSPLSGQQNITTYTVGFTIDLPILADTAERGGGRYYTADDTATLANALTSIVTAILSEDTTFTAPTVAVNSFNRTQNLSDLFISVFRPSGRTHWPGNLKKYRIRAGDATIVDANGAPAIDPATGFFANTARSYWSAVVDGRTADVGGAADLIQASPNRVVYTHLSGNNLTTTANRVATANLALTDAVLNTGAVGEPTRDQVIDFINGLDTPDTDQDNAINDPRTQMGDPLHAQPVSVIYGPDLRDGLVFMATNDGFLHAIDLESGVEQWAFVPPEFLGDQVDLYTDESAASKQYGIDSDLRIQMVADNDGIIEPGEKVYLFFGMGRGGDFYYGLDVTDPLSPQLLWKLDSGTLPGLGQTWSSPMPTRIDVAGATQNADKLVLVLGGGYEPDQDNANLTTDIIGNSIYIVDSVSGALLWHGSRDGVHKDFNVSGRSMDYSIPARIRVIDIDGDGFADRMYAGDMGGQVWRFDITNGQSAANLVVGAVIAQLGGAPSVSPNPEDVRRFYNAPDVAFISTRDQNFIHVGIGSGHRGHPLSTSVEDSFYALRDYAIGARTQAQLDGLTLIEHDDLVPVTGVNTSVASNAPGWRIDLSIGGWNGEKVLAEARTFANQVIFSTFQPSTTVSTCEPQLGTNRTYAMSVYNGNPVMNLDSSADPTTLTMSDVFVEAEGGILSAAQALFVDRDSDGDGIPDAEDDSDGDGLSDANDDDDNGDGVPDDMEDPDGDGVPNYMDGDDDGDGMPDDVDSEPRRPNANEDPDGDGIPNYLDDDDDGDGVLDVDDDNDDVVCVALRCFSGVMRNDPIRTFWAQDSVD
jgi:type IV pilus assembly protein PilY1